MEDISIPRNPPPKPKRSVLNGNAHGNGNGDDEYSDVEYGTSPVRRGRTTRMERRDQSPPPHTPSYPPARTAKLSIVDAEPETTIGAAVKMKGDLSFERLLRIEGEFDGKLISKGSVVIGPRGVLTGNVDNMKEVYVAGGKIVGNITVEKLVLRDKAQVFGNVTAKSVRIDPECVVVGRLNVNPQAPERINDKGEIVKAEPTPPAAAAPPAES